MPMFARKYGVCCGTCHTTIPRLNLTGYKFPAAGFRMPEAIGQCITKTFDLGNYFPGRLQSRFDVQATNQPNGAAVANLTAGARYDWFHPRDPTNNARWAFTPYVNIPLQNGLQIIAEFQHRDFELAPGTYHRKNETPSGKGPLLSSQPPLPVPGPESMFVSH